MKKPNLLKLSFWTMALFAAVAFTSCVDDNADDGMPYLEVTPDLIVFNTAGEPVGVSTVTVKTNRPWNLNMDSSVDWITASATSGNGDAVVEFVVPATSAGRSATVSFSLSNSYGAYITRDIAVEQGEIGPVTRLLGYIKATWPTDPANGSPVALNYSETTVEGVILANNAGGNNRGKLYVGDNITQPGSAVILYSLDYNAIDNYPVGKKVTLDLSQAKYAPYSKLRELTDVTVTVSPDPVVALNIPSITAAQFNSGNYQGQYVKINDVSPADGTVGKPWTTTNYQTLDFLSGTTTLAVYMRGSSEATAFAGLTVEKKTGAIFGVAEQYLTTVQLLPTDPEDIITFIDAVPKVTTLDATNLDKTSATLNGSKAFIDNATEVGFEYMDYAAVPDWTGAQKVTGTLTDNKWSADVTGLTQGKKYSFRAYAKTASDTYYGDMKDFTPDTAADVVANFAVPANIPDGFPKSSSDAAAATEKTWKFDNQDFLFHPSTSNKYYITGGTAVLIGKNGAYIGLPAISGKSLSKVRCTTNASGTLSSGVMVGVYNAAGTVLQGGADQEWTNVNNTVYEYDLGGTAVNTSYRLQINTDKNIQIAKIELWYNDGATPGKPEITVDPASLAFGAAADATGKTVAITTTNDTGLTLFASSTDETQFPMTLVGKTLTVKALANADEEDSKTATITVYLAASKDAERKATATVAVSQAPKTPKTVAELVTYLNSADVNPAFNTQKALTDWNGMVITGYIAGNNSGSNLNKMLAVVDNNASVPGAGVIIYDDAYNTTADYPIGAKVQITIGADSYCKNNYGMLRLEKVTATVDKNTTVTINPLSVTAAQFNAANYVGMYVKITGLKYKEMLPQKWNTGSATSTSSQTFVAGTDEAVIRTYGGCAWAGDYISATKTNGSISGIGQVYVGAAGGTAVMQLNPMSAANVADFNITTPMIVDADPASVVLAGAGGSQVVTLTILNQGSNAVSVSGLSAPFSASVAGNIVTVSAPANTTGAAIPAQTLTISLVGGNNITVSVSQLVPGAKEYSLISSITDLTAGTYYMAGYLESYTSGSNTTTFAPYSYHVWNGTVTTGSSAYAATVGYEYNTTTGALTANPANGTSAASMELVAVAGKANTYYIKIGSQYLTTTSATANHSFALSTTPQEWTFSAMASPKTGILATSDSPAVMGTAGAASNLIRTYKTSSVGSLTAGLFFFKKN